MASSTYHVVLTGEVASGKKPDRVRKAFGKRVGLPAERVDALFDRAPVVIRRDLGENEAAAYLAALEKTGAVLDLMSPEEVAAARRPEGSPGSSGAAPARAQTPPTPPPSAPTPSEDAGGAGRHGPARGWTWVAEGFGSVRANPGAWAGIVVLLFVVGAVAAILGPLAFLVWAILIGGIMSGCEAQARGEGLRVGTVFAGFRGSAGRLAGLGLLYLVALAATMAVSMGAFMALGGGMGALMQMSGAATQGGELPPGLMAALGGAVAVGFLVYLLLLVIVSMAFWFTPALVTLRGTGVVEAVRLSFTGCLRNLLAFLVYGVAWFAILLVLSVLPGLVPVPVVGLVLGLVALIVNVFVVTPALLASIHRAYRDIYGASD